MPAQPEAHAPSPRDDAIRLLARREYSRAELAQRLASRAHPP
ncbi:MAG: regulatory protein RecX, partial [Halomonas sp.]|nr:regulatory protein RecX [Halomonas sp.]MDX5502345.1 regulatory protein RecX [Halomonas sp.]